MRIVGTIGGNLQAIINNQLDDLSRALVGAVGRASARLQEDLRKQTRAAGLGAGLANAWRRETYPKGRSRTLRPAGLVYSRSTVLHDAFNRGPAILPRQSRYLVVPLPEAIRLKLDRTGIARKGGSVPAGQQRKYADLDAAAAQLGAVIVSARVGGHRARGDRGRFSGGDSRPDRPRIILVPSARRPGALVALYQKARDQKPVPLFLLLRATKLPRRLDIDSAAARAEDYLAAEVSAAVQTLGG